MDDEVRRRLTWIRLYEQTGDVGLVCRRCGISAPTLRKWLHRFEEPGEAGLVAQSRRPKTSPRRKVFEQEEAWILELRRERNFGARRIQQKLRRQHRLYLSLEAIHTVLKRHAAPPLRRPKRPQQPLRYSASLPGARAQMDTMKLAPGLYGPVPVHLHRRLHALPRRRPLLPPHGRQHAGLPGADLRRDPLPHPSAADRQRHGVHGLQGPRRAIRAVHQAPADPSAHAASPRQGRARPPDDADRVLRDHDLRQPQPGRGPGSWLLDYNHRRVHGSLGKTPMQRWAELNEQTPMWDDIADAFDPAKEIAYVDQLTLRRRKAKASK